MRMLIFSIARLVKYMQSDWNFARITIRPIFYLELDRILYDSVHNSVSFIQCLNILFPVTAVVKDTTSIHTSQINKRPMGLIAHLTNISNSTLLTQLPYIKNNPLKAYVTFLLNTKMHCKRGQTTVCRHTLLSLSLLQNYIQFYLCHQS